ncbi:hypothetical protein C8Q77DRAFT_842350 [Trametes polyzona]|nr:hypothetical protein C8Q77DRAFT_842350 [Trametes polyzona]
MPMADRKDPRPAPPTTPGQVTVVATYAGPARGSRWRQTRYVPDERHARMRTRTRTALCSSLRFPSSPLASCDAPGRQYVVQLGHCRPQSRAPPNATRRCVYLQPPPIDPLLLHGRHLDRLAPCCRPPGPFAVFSSLTFPPPRLDGIRNATPLQLSLFEHSERDRHVHSVSPEACIPKPSPNHTYGATSTAPRQGFPRAPTSSLSPLSPSLPWNAARPGHHRPARISGTLHLRKDVVANSAWAWASAQCAHPRPDPGRASRSTVCSATGRRRRRPWPDQCWAQCPNRFARACARAARARARCVLVFWGYTNLSTTSPTRTYGNA